MMLGQDPGELGKRFLRAVLLIAADQDHVLSLTGTSLSFEHDAGSGD
jgi:hypothetical protein